MPTDPLADSTCSDDLSNSDNETQQPLYPHDYEPEWNEAAQRRLTKFLRRHKWDVFWNKATMVVSWILFAWTGTALTIVELPPALFILFVSAMMTACAWHYYLNLKIPKGNCYPPQKRTICLIYTTWLSFVVILLFVQIECWIQAMDPLPAKTLRFGRRSEFLTPFCTLAPWIANIIRTTMLTINFVVAIDACGTSIWHGIQLNDIRRDVMRRVDHMRDRDSRAAELAVKNA